MYFFFIVIVLLCGVQINTIQVECYKRSYNEEVASLDGSIDDYAADYYYQPSQHTKNKKIYFVKRNTDTLQKLANEVKDEEEHLAKTMELTKQLEEQILVQEKSLQNLENSKPMDLKKQQAIKILSGNIETLKNLFESYESQINALKKSIISKRKELQRQMPVDLKIVLRQNPATEVASIPKDSPSLVNVLGSILNNKISAFVGLLDGVRNVTSVFFRKLTTDADLVKGKHLLNLPLIASSLPTTAITKTNNILRKLALVLE